MTYFSVPIPGGDAVFSWGYTGKSKTPSARLLRLQYPDRIELCPIEIPIPKKKVRKRNAKAEPQRSMTAAEFQRKFGNGQRPRDR